MQVAYLQSIYTECLEKFSDAPHVVLNKGEFGIQADLVSCLMLTQTAHMNIST